MYLLLSIFFLVKPNRLCESNKPVLVSKPTSFVNQVSIEHLCQKVCMMIAHDLCEFHLARKHYVLLRRHKKPCLFERYKNASLRCSAILIVMFSEYTIVQIRKSDRHIIPFAVVHLDVPDTARRFVAAVRREFAVYVFILFHNQNNVVCVPAIGTVSINMVRKILIVKIFFVLVFILKYIAMCSPCRPSAIPKYTFARNACFL